MNHVEIRGANITLAEGQPEFAPLVARREITKSKHHTSGEEYDALSITVAFRPTAEDLVSLLNGGTLYVRQLGGWAPTAVWVE